MSEKPCQPLREPDDPNRSGAAAASRFDMSLVLRELIAEELRCGRLNGARRRRIRQYARAMGLTDGELGRLFAECGEDARQDDDAVVRTRTLPLVQPEAEWLPAGVKLALVASIAIALDILLITLVW